MHIDLGFGKCTIGFDIDEKNLAGILNPNTVEVSLKDVDEVRRSLLEPIGSKRLRDIVKPGEKIVIITSDITRPMPGKLMLPEIINELYFAGIKDIKIVFALGSHRKHTEAEKKYLVGEKIYETIECIDSDINNCEHLGFTSSGTPVDIFKPVVQADRRICLGNIEYHYFAGYSGGAKAIMPGVSTRDAIQANHSRMVQKEAKAGDMENNPVRKDIEEVAKFVPIDFILNVVLDDHKNIIKSVAGHFSEAHKAGCAFLDTLYKIKIPEKADIVIVSAGGFPKDINLYQAQKALDNAKHAVRTGGIIILVGSCKEGYGEEVFEKWINRAKSPDDLIDEVQNNFELGGHKAAAIALVLNQSDVYLVSDLSEEQSNKIFMKKYREIKSALNDAFQKLGRESKVLVMPYGGSTLPYIGV